jgi:hypothetical protein
MTEEELTGEELVTSSCSCKYGEGAVFPFQAESLENGVDDAIDTFYVHIAHHGPGAASYFHQAALDHVGGTQFRHVGLSVLQWSALASFVETRQHFW